MVDRIQADSAELRNLYLDLRGAPVRIQRGARKRLNEGRLIVEREMKQDARGARRSTPSTIRHLPKSVTSEMVTEYTAEIGMAPRKGTQGSLAHILAYGTATHPPIFDHTAGLRRAEPRILRLFADEAESDVLGGER